MTMTAMVLREHGGSEVLHLEPLDVPEPGPHEVRVRAVALNRATAAGPDVEVSTMDSKADLLAVLSRVAAGRLQPIVHQVLPLAGAAATHRTLENRAAFGKVVLEP